FPAIAPTVVFWSTTASASIRFCRKTARAEARESRIRVGKTSFSLPSAPGTVPTCRIASRAWTTVIFLPLSGRRPRPDCALSQRGSKRDPLEPLHPAFECFFSPDQRGSNFHAPKRDPLDLLEPLP